MKILLINLERRIDRLENFDKNFPNISYEKIHAIDGKLLEKKDNNIYYQNILLFNDSLKFSRIKKGEIGCFLSHKLAWEKIIKYNEPCLIFEDDVCPLDKFKERFTKINYPDNYEILYLGIWTNYDQQRFVSNKNNFNLINNYFIYNQKRQLYPYAYILTPTGAMKLIEKLNQADFICPVDHFIHQVFQNKEYVVYPYLCHAPQGNSDIQGKENIIFL